MYDYGWRQYDPAIGRFLKIDRFAEKYYDKTNYGYAANNPIYFVDIQGDSLVVHNNAAGSALRRFENISNQALGGFYTMGQSSTGKYILNATNQIGPMTKEQAAFHKIMSQVTDSSKDVVFDGVDSSDKISENIIIGDNGSSPNSASPGIHTLDFEDMEKIGTNGLLTAQGALGHEIKEGNEIQQNGRRPIVAHNMGIAFENAINGTTSSGGTINANMTQVNIPVTNKGKTTNVQINVTNGQIQNIQNNIK